MRKKKEFNRISMGWNITFNLMLCICALLVLLPVLLVVIVSFSSTESIEKLGYSYFPSEWSLQGYYYIFKMGEQVASSYIVTIANSVIGTVLTLAVNALYGYVLTQKKFWLRGFLTYFVFVPMLIGAGLVPNYMINTQVYHLGDTFWILVLPGLVSGSSAFIMRTFINTTIPDTLFDAAKIDGAGHFRIFTTIVLPLSKAGLAVLGLNAFVLRWNDWFTGMLYISNPKLVPLQTMLTKLQKNVDFIKQNAEVTSTPDGLQLIKSMPSDNLRMAILVISIAPIMFAYPFFQRYFVKGLVVGSVKG